MTDWPTSEELGALFAARGVSLSGLSPQACIDAAISAFERDTGYRPFKAETADSTRYFSVQDVGHRGLLDLRAGYVSVTSVTVGVSATEVGSALTVNVDYWAEPVSGDGPINFIRFLSEPAGYPRSIVVAGKRGYAASIPAEAWQAVLNRAAIESLSQVEAGAVDSTVQGPVTINYGDMRRGLQSQYESAVGHFKRVGI